MTNRSISLFTYIQSLTYCLSRDRCTNCVYNDYDYKVCSLFDGYFNKLPFNVPLLECVCITWREHENTQIDCDHLCVYLHKNTFYSECYYSDFMNKIAYSIPYPR